MNKIKPVSLSDFIPVGKVIRPHGLKGLLRVMSYAGAETSFLNSETTLFKNTSGLVSEFVICSVAPHKNIFLLGVEGINSAEEAEVYRGSEILLRKQDLKREEDTFFWYELEGLDVYLNTGECLGKIFRIFSTGSNDIYVVRQGEKEIYIPAIHEVIEAIDLDDRKMIVSPMDGLLDLNEV